MKTKEELTALKNEVETLNAKLAELSEEELKQVTGGKYIIGDNYCPICGAKLVLEHDRLGKPSLVCSNNCGFYISL